MPNQMYMNPSAIGPQTGQMANRGLAGVYQIEDRANQQRMLGLQQLLTQMQGMREAEDLTQGAPVRQATREATLRDLPVKSRGLEAQTRGQELGTMFDEAMHPGKVEAGLQQQGLDKGQQSIAQAIQIIAQTPPGPDYLPRIGQNVKKSGIDPKIFQSGPLQHILNTADPEEASRRAQAFLKQQDATNPAYRQAIDTANTRGAWDYARQGLANQGSLATAGRNAQGKVKSLEEEWNSENVPLNKASLAAQILSSDKANPRLKKEAERWMKEMAGIIQGLMLRGAAPELPGLPKPSPVPLPGQGGPTPNPQPQTAPDPLGIRR